jgi:cytochrome P450
MSLFTTFDHYNFPLGLDGTPYDYFEALRDEAIETNTPIGWSEVYGGFWVVIGWEESREIMYNTTAFSNRGVTFPRYGQPDDHLIMLSSHDPGSQPDHKKYRQLVQGPFSPKNAASISEPLRAATNKLIDKFIDDGKVEIVEAFTNEVPAQLTAIILGLPPEHGAMYRTWTHAMAQDAHTNPELLAAHMRDLEAYFKEVLEHRRENLGDDVLSVIIQSEIDGERLSYEDIRDFWVVILLGGIDNTTKLFGTMFWRLAWDKELRRRLVRNRQLLPTAIEEFLRFYAPGSAGRIVTEPISVGGVKMEPGQQVLLMHPITNRDPRQFKNPDVFIPERSPNRHFGLGLGVHRCLGAHLVKVEAQVVAEEFFRRIPEWELDPGSNSTWLHGQVAGMEEVNIVFPPGGGYFDGDWADSRDGKEASQIS